jgi:hypothetical protein
MANYVVGGSPSEGQPLGSPRTGKRKSAGMILPEKFEANYSPIGTRANERVATVFAYIAVALVLRSVTFGNPVVHIDEQFYLLVGERMLHGALPYVDIWDRKPVGLFALYAAMRALGGDGVIQYQLMALAFVVATSLTINRLARQISSPAGAWWAGMVYLPYLSTFGCFGGQAPVFYNLLVALAALVICHCLTTPDSRRLLVGGLLAMALIGLAIQIKYTVVFEGFVFGLVLLFYARRAGWPLPRLILAALIWAGCALTPTGLALAAYQWIGQGQLFIEANFVSIFLRDQAFLPSIWRLAKETAILAPFWLAIFWAPGRITPQRGVNPAAASFLRLWAAAAVVGFLLFGTWLDHYVAPLLAPLAALAAPALGWSPRRRFYTTFALLVSIIGAIADTTDQRLLFGGRAEVDRASAVIRQHLAGGCFYMFEGDDPILYSTTNACTVTRYIFPQHLSSIMETRALGVNQLEEERRALGRRPSVIMTGTRCPSCAPSSPENPAVVALVATTLHRDYVPIGTVKIGRRSYNLFQRRDLAELR